MFLYCSLLLVGNSRIRLSNPVKQLSSMSIYVCCIIITNKTTKKNSSFCFFVSCFLPVLCHEYPLHCFSSPKRRRKKNKKNTNDFNNKHLHQPTTQRSGHHFKIKPHRKELDPFSIQEKKNTNFSITQLDNNTNNSTTPSLLLYVSLYGVHSLVGLCLLVPK